MRSMCASAHVFHIGEIGCEAISCMGIDIQAARPAPVGKRFGVDERAEDGLSASLHLLLSALGLHSPFDERGGQFVAIGHDPAHRVVILEAVPDHA